MKLSTRQAGEVAIVDVAGNLDTTTSPEAQQHLDDLQGGGTTKILVNFAALDYISSAGLRILLATAKGLGSSGGGLRVCGLNESVREVFRISGFDLILNVFADEKAALGDF